jgi:hypothetical protein
MACEIISCEGGVFALWGKETTKADVDRVLDRLKLVADATGHPVVYVSRVPSDAAPPAAAVRAHVDANMPLCVSLCSSYHVVLEGNGFINAMKRAVLAGLFQIRWRKGTFFVHAVPKEVIFKLDRAERTVGEKLLALAEGRGLLTCSAPEPAFPAQKSA